jgi:hypothetical protein
MARATNLFAYLCLSMGLLILMHQYVFHGVWFEMADIHHETLSIAFFSFGLGVLLGVGKGTGKP